VDTAAAKGKLVREIIDGAEKIYQEEGGIGSIGADKIKANVFLQHEHSGF